MTHTRYSFLTLLAAAFLLVPQVASAQSFAPTPGDNGGPVVEVDGPIAPVLRNGGITITQNVNTEDVTSGGIRCANNDAGYTTENSFYRLFDLGEIAEITEGFATSSATVGINVAAFPNSIPTPQIGAVRLYNVTAPPSGGIIAAGDLELRSEVEFDLNGFPGPKATGYIQDVDISAQFAADELLLIEMFIPSGNPDDTGFEEPFSISQGENDDGETAPVYLASASCGITDPTEIGALVPDAVSGWVVTITGANSSGNSEPSVFAGNLSGASSVAQLADGRVLVTTFDRVTAFNADGSGRTVFADNLDGPVGITQLSNGRVLVTEVNFNQGSGRVVAFNADGSGRTTFSDNLGSATGVTQLTNDQVLVGEPTGARVVAFNADGTGQVFFAENITPWGLTQLADGRVLVVDYIEDQVVALNANGSGRTVFADGFDFPRGITQLADGRVLVTNVVEDQVVAFNANGSGRTIFADGFVSPTDVTQLADGRVLVTDEAGQVLAFSLSPPTANEGDARPDAFVLGAGYPNPAAHGTVTVPFALERAAEVRLALYDVLGREVAVFAEGVRTAGEHEVTLATGALPSGVYVVRLTADETSLTRRVTVVR